MLLSDDIIENKKNAQVNQNNYNNLNDQTKKNWINNVYKYYNNSIPLVEYSINDIKYSFSILENKQNYKVIINNNNFANLKKYNFYNLIKFIGKNKTNDIEIINKSKKFGNKIKNFMGIKLVIYDYDYKKNYVNISLLSDFYQNGERVLCKVLNNDTPQNYYEKKYMFILNKYFSNLKKYYEEGLLINELTFENNKTQYSKSINPIYLQNIMYENNKFCTVYKPYLFKLFIQIFKGENKPKILDLSSGWGDRLLGALSIQDEIEKYIGIDPNEKLSYGYNKMINDLASEKNKKKFIILQKQAEEVEFVELDKDIDIIFWSPPFFDQELYIIEKERKDYSNQSIQKFKNYDDWENFFLINILNLASNNLKLNGVIILYIGHIKYDTFYKKMNNILKIKNIGYINILSDKVKNYIIFVKTEKNKNCVILQNKNIFNIENIENNSIVQEIKNKLKHNVTNPDLNIIELNLNNKKINLIQDSVLVAGTKQRVVVNFIEKILETNKNITTLTYAGTFNGYGAVATAFGAYKLGLKSKVFLSTIPTGSKNNEPTKNNVILNSKQINTLEALDATIYLCEDYRTAKNMQYDITTLPTTEQNIWITKKEYYNVPLGLNDDDKIMVKLLSKQIKKASENTIINKIKNPRIWLVAGTGGITESLKIAFPTAIIFVYLTGGGKYIKKVIEYLKKNNITILNNNPDFDIVGIKNDYSNYYQSVSDYDSLIWPYVKKYALNNDFIYNIASN
jgi:hypothetical protein